MESYASVIIDISHEKLDRVFEYRIPEALQGSIKPGARVKIPFGAGNREISGYVVDISDRPEYDKERLKDIISVEGDIPVKDPETELIALAVWIKRHYGGTLIKALKVVLPIRKSVKPKEKRTVKLLVSKEEAAKLSSELEKKHHRARARLLSALSECPQIEYSLVRDRLGISSNVLKAFSEQGILSIESESLYRNPRIYLPGDGNQGYVLTEEQSDIVESFWRDYTLGIRTPALLHGITGSGKTEIYMELISRVAGTGKSAIVLIPEIALTFQTVMRFYKRFGERVSYLHSKLSMGERYDQYKRALNGELDIMIGPRSALFTPFRNLGIIIVDEEHENSYKAENMPKYHAREAAIERAALSQAAVLLGSATPSVDSYYRAKRGEYRLYELKNRVKGLPLPRVYVEDMRRELDKGNKSIFSRRLKSLIEDRLRKSEQTMLFLNRRGYAGFVNCRKCGFVMKCPHCDVALTSHRDGTLQCHYCGYSTLQLKLCPECGSKYFGGMKAGTEQVETAVMAAFPDAKVLRMDADTTKKKEDYEKILSSFSEGKADILIGTQMIVKGHDFPLVTLVGILAADLSLYVSDYRSSERTFSLLTQCAGRAGRADRPGEVVIQTYSPEHYSVTFAASQDYKGFYQKEIGFRTLMDYPPVSHLLKILIEDRSDSEAMEMARALSELTRSFSDAVTIGPARDLIAKIKDVYRHVLFVKHGDYERLTQIKDAIELYRRENPTGSTQIQFDFDPI